MNEIGTLSEKSIHAQLKLVFQPDNQYHEIKVGRYIADICMDKKIVEIQTGQLYKLEKKLAFYLEQGYDVTVVYPVIMVNTLHWMDLEGEIITSRKTTKKKAMYQIFSELSGITDFIDHPFMKIKVLCLQCQEIRVMDGYGKDKKSRATKYTKGMDEILEEIEITSCEDVKTLLPMMCNHFTATMLGKTLGLKSRKRYLAVHALENLGLIEKVGKENRSILWKMVEK